LSNFGGAVRSAWSHTPRVIRTPLAIFGRAFQLYVNDDCSSYAGAIAYYALFSLVPLALIMLTVLGLVIDKQDIVNFVFEQLPLEDTADVRQRVADLVDRSRELSGAGISVSLVLLLWSSSALFSAVRKGLNATASDLISRPFWHGKLVDFALVVSLGLLISASIGLTAFTRIAIVHTLELGGTPLNAHRVFEISSYAVSATLSFMMFLLMYRSVPIRHPNWNRAVWGAVFATILFEMLKNLSAVFLEKTSFHRDAAVYAGVSAVFVFLFWVWLNASILLFGAEFGRAVVEHQQVNAGERRGVLSRAAFWRRAKPVHPPPAGAERP
jgi:membrane protein